MKPGHSIWWLPRPATWFGYNGLFRRGQTDPASSVDAALILHGLGGNFYSSKLNLRLAASLHQMGISVVLGNTRGHDGVSTNTVAGRAKTIGAAYEIVDECRYDVHGWVEWLGEQGCQRVILVGHSLGAIKSLYAQANDPHGHVVGIVSFSATRLNHQQLMESSRGKDFAKWIAKSQELVESGQGQDLMHVDFPFPTHICAASYWDKYGPANRYDWLKLAEGVSIPVLLAFGENELRDNPAFQGLIQDVQRFVESAGEFNLEIVKSADHFYSGVHHRASQAMTDWIGDRFARIQE